jgi:hypothetical protein
MGTFGAWAVFTSDEPNAGTDARVHVVMYGVKDGAPRRTQRIALESTAAAPPFQRDQVLNRLTLPRPG